MKFNSPIFGQELPHEGNFMSNSISGGISFSGIGSGTDFTQLVDQLLEVESFRLYNLEDSREVAMESYDAMTDLISTVTEAKDALSQINSPSEFLLKLASSSLETVASATADSEAVDGTFTVDVQQLATNAIWASRSTYASKTTNINPTADTTFSYTYKGETHTLDVPKNTTLEGLAYMINQDKANPGVKMQIINTAEGHTFQIAGTDSGADANLQIHPTSMTGFGSSNSSWESYITLDPTQNIGNGQTPSTFEYDLVLAGGTAVPTFSLQGDATQQEFVTALNNAAGSNVAEINSSGKLVLTGVQSLTTTIDGTAQTPLEIAPTMSGTFSGDLETPVAAGTYTFTDADGNNFDVVMAADGTMNTFLTELGKQEGVSIGYETDGAGNSTLNFTGITGIVSSPVPITLDSPDPSYEYSTNAVAGDAIQAGMIPHTFTLDIIPDSGPAYSVVLDTSMDYTAMTAAINDQSPAGVSASIDPTTNKLVVEGISSLDSSSSAFSELMNFSGRVTTTDGWIIQEAQNAEFQLNNFEQVLTSSTNEVTGVIEGVTLNLKSVGEAQITIASDTDSVKANIQTFLDAINSIILKVQDLTAVSEEPTSTYDDEGTVTSSALTGEYSVRSFSSRLKDTMIGSPSGFQSLTGDDVFSGDLIATLSQMGIKTVTDVDDPSFGLFAIAPSSAVDELQQLDQETFDNYLANNLEEVINFFAASDSGVTSSGSFGYSNHIAGITEPGTYDVVYTVNADGSANVTIGGEVANRSSGDSNVYTVGGDGPQSGLSITLYDLEPGVEKTGTVSIQRGIVPTMESFFSAELQFYPPSETDPTIGQNNGGLMIAQDNYQALVDSIDNQIGNELDRLEVWEYNQRMKYARLDTLLGEYNNNMTMLNQQLAQIGS